MALRMITDELETYIPSLDNKELLKQKSYIIPKPQGKFTILGFCKHLKETERDLHYLIKTAIADDIGVVYLCDKLPNDYIIDQHIIYVVAQWRWLHHTLFINPLQFKACFGNKYTEKLCEAFSCFTQYNIPIINNLSDIKEMNEHYIEYTNNVLAEINGGVGDNLISIPALKTLADKGKKVYVLCDEKRNSCFDNLDFISGIINRKDRINISHYDRIYWLHFGQILNDYRMDLNKQNRIYSVANICGFDKESLSIDRPLIILTNEEKQWAKELLKGYKNTVFLGLDSARTEAKYPETLAINLIESLKQNGYTPILTAIKQLPYDCINFSKGTTLRQLFALINECEYVITVDTSFLHIAGALEKKIILLPNVVPTAWRASTYKNCVAIEPKVKCYYCCGGMRFPQDERMCVRNSGACFKSIPIEEIIAKLKLL
jgi:ADP-heptose:LPS heptosyltransferase